MYALCDLLLRLGRVARSTGPDEAAGGRLAGAGTGRGQCGTGGAAAGTSGATGAAGGGAAAAAAAADGPFSRATGLPTSRRQGLRRPGRSW